MQRETYNVKRATCNVAFLLAVLLASGVVGAADAHAQPDAHVQPSEVQRADEERLNVLWIVAEDLSTDLAQARTPHLDRLARQGTRFTRAFAAAPACSPSRSALITGVPPTRLGPGVLHHRPPDSLKRPLPDEVRPLTDLMRDAGYFTANVRDLPGTDVRGTGKNDWNFAYDGRPFDTDQWRALSQNQPFFAQVNLPETHRPWDTGSPVDPLRVSVPPYVPDHPVTRADWAGYLGEVARLDEKVGAILNRLDADGLAENTVVFFFADHGRPMLRAKQWTHDAGLRVPLIVRWPGEEASGKPSWYAPGQATGRLTSLIDLAPTALALAGADVPDGMAGRSLREGGDGTPARRYVFGAAGRSGGVDIRSRTARSKHFRYIRNDEPRTPHRAASAYRRSLYPSYHLVGKLHEEGRLTPAERLLGEPRPAEVLYDLRSDPHELHNLASSPAHRDRLERMRRALRDWTRRNEAAAPEPPALARFFETYRKRTSRYYADRIERLRRRVYRADSTYVRAMRRLGE